MLLSCRTTRGIWSHSRLEPTWSLTNGSISTSSYQMVRWSFTRLDGSFVASHSVLVLILMKHSVLWSSPQPFALCYPWPFLVDGPFISSM